MEHSFFPMTLAYLKACERPQSHFLLWWLQQGRTSSPPLLWNAPDLSSFCTWFLQHGGKEHHEGGVGEWNDGEEKSIIHGANPKCGRRSRCLRHTGHHERPRAKQSRLKMHSTTPQPPHCLFILAAPACGSLHDWGRNDLYIQPWKHLNDGRWGKRTEGWRGNERVAAVWWVWRTTGRTNAFF